MNDYKPLVAEKYKKRVVTDVLLQDGGFEIHFGSLVHWLPTVRNPHKIVPKIGDTAFCYGDGFGRPVLGLQLNDKLVFFNTREEHERDRQAMIRGWKERDKKKHVELMEKIKDEPPFETVDVSGMGSGYERACQLMIQSGIKFLKDNEFHFDYYTYKGVYGICVSDAPWSKDLDKALIDAAGGDCSGAMHQCVIGHLQIIHKQGYDKWVRSFPKGRRYMYPKELPAPN